MGRGINSMHRAYLLGLPLRQARELAGGDSFANFKPTIKQRDDPLIEAGSRTGYSQGINTSWRNRPEILKPVCCVPWQNQFHRDR